MEVSDEFRALTGKEPPVLFLSKMLGGPQSRSGRFGEEKDRFLSLL